MILFGKKLAKKKRAGFKLGKWIHVKVRESFMFNG